MPAYVKPSCVLYHLNEIFRGVGVGGREEELKAGNDIGVNASYQILHKSDVIT